MKLKIYNIILLISMITFSYCSNEWEDHYMETESSVNVSLWDTLKASSNYSEFVKYIELFHLDTIINSDQTKTLFIPTNDAFNTYFSGDTSRFRATLAYHIIPTYYMIRNIENNQSHRLRTLEGKYTIIQNFNQAYYYDGVEIETSSPMFLDGKYYEINRVAIPKPNIYEYIALNNPAFQRYIDLQDSVFLDKELSKALGFNELGQTIYDSVTVIHNLFEEKYFEISREYNNIYATLAIPGRAGYEAALDEMAQNLGGEYNSFEDIPASWQNNVLIPILLHKGLYGGLLNELDFENIKYPNVAGDTIIIDFEIDPNTQYVCSNGKAYEYQAFSVGDSLYKEKIMEGEDLCEKISAYQYSWDDEKVKVVGNKSFKVTKERTIGASNDTVVNVNFGTNYEQTYSVSFKMEDVFPQRYRLVWRTNYRTTGLYKIYVNDEVVKLGISNYEVYDTYKLISGFFSVLGYKLYPDPKGFCNVDGWVDNISEFGDVTIKIEYTGPGSASENGLNIDYVKLESE